METLKVDIQYLKKKYPSSGFPMLEYCKYLVKKGQDPETRLEAWNYERRVPEWDWAVSSIGEYAKNKLPREKMEEWGRGF